MITPEFKGNSKNEKQFNRPPHSICCDTTSFVEVSELQKDEKKFIGVFDFFHSLFEPGNSSGTP